MDRPIVFIASSDPLDVRSFSGTLLFMVRGLRAEFPEMEVLRNVRSRWYYRLEHFIHSRTDRTSPYMWPLLARYFAFRLRQKLKHKNPIVICVVDAPMAAELGRHLDVINVSDSTFELMRNYYDAFARIVAHEATAERYERLSIQRAAHNSFSSRWAADSAIQHYGGRPDRVSAISWGCNIPTVPRAAAKLDVDGTTCRLLFLGMDWTRKGADVTLEALRLLRARGLDVTLDLVGALPPEGTVIPEGATVHGRLSKDDPEQFAHLTTLIERSGFLFLPTFRDCTPMVFAEANAYGIPGVTRDTGGVGDVVRDGENGITLPEAATPTEFADAIAELWADRPRYLELRRTARQSYEDRLNWSVWARRMREIIERLPAA